MTTYLHSELTSAIINAFYSVHSELGFGFLEKVYENALAIALRERGFHVVQQAPIPVWFHRQKVGEYYADIIVDEKVILELKAAESLVPEHEKQLLNYLKATEIQVGLLLNFGRRAEVRRKVFETARNKRPVGQDGGALPK